MGSQLSLAIDNKLVDRSVVYVCGYVSLFTFSSQSELSTSSLYEEK